MNWNIHKVYDKTETVIKNVCEYNISVFIGILLAICSKLYEDGIFPQDSFIQWEQCNDPSEREGKGISKISVYKLLL